MVGNEKAEHNNKTLPQRIPLVSCPAMSHELLSYPNNAIVILYFHVE
jgi:hypothetical protein